MRALVTGATGFIGRRLVARLQRPVVLTRDAAKAKMVLGDVEAFAWEPEEGLAPPAAFDGVDAVIHLAGETVAGRWTQDKKRRILNSRVLGTRNLVATIGALATRPRVLVSTSAVGYYGSCGDQILDESSPAGRDFLAGVCKEWEETSAAARELGVRVVNPRIGLVLGEKGGALERMLFPFRMGLGGPIGSGKQWWPWVHVDDVVGILLHAISSNDMTGPINAVGPQPVTNLEFTRALGAVLKRPAFLPMPEFALRLTLGEFTDALVSSARVIPAVAVRTGYQHSYTSLERALHESVK